MKIITAAVFYLLYWFICFLCTGTDKKNLAGLRSYPDEVQARVRREPQLAGSIPKAKSMPAILLSNLLLFTAVFSILGAALKQELAAKGIEFVSRYSFWAIFRSEHDFRLYTPEEDLAVCERIRRPMPAGAVLSWLAFLVFLRLTAGVSPWFGVPACLLADYAAMCTCLGISYGRLVRELRKGDYK